MNKTKMNKTVEQEKKSENWKQHVVVKSVQWTRKQFVWCKDFTYRIEERSNDEQGEADSRNRTRSSATAEWAHI